MIAAPPAEELDYQQFQRDIRVRSGIELEDYKPEQMERRLRGLLARAGVSGYAAYLRLLDSDTDRLRQLRDFVTINVSEFFRAPDRFAALRDVVLPRLLAARPRLRVWSAGCSYGAEAYSLALLLEELTPGLRHDIVATDVDESVLARARAASDFSARDVRHVRSPERYFELRGERWALDAELRSRVAFRPHDVLTDEFESGFDLIVCRNVMIYFTPKANQRVAGKLYEAVRPGGYLFAGSSEALAQLCEAGFKQELVALYRR